MNVLLAGLGSAGQRHARNLLAVLGGEVKLSAYRVRGLKHIITPDMKIEPGDVEAKYGVRVFTSLDEALAEKPDAVFITNPPNLHMPVALAAARAGCPLFIEKPLSHNFEGVAELVDIVERKRLVCLVGYQLRFHPGLRLLQSCMETNATGQVLAARLSFGEYLPDWHPYEDYREMHESHRDLGGGVILSQIHDLDYALALFGLPRRIFALGGHLSTLHGEAEDTASMLLECSVGGRAVPVHLHLDCVQRPPTRTCEIIGDEGRIFLDFNAPRADVFDGAGRLVRTDLFDGYQRNQLFLDELRHFLMCLRGEVSPIVGVRDATRSLQVALAARESIETGTVVELA